MLASPDLLSTLQSLWQSPTDQAPEFASTAPAQEATETFHGRTEFYWTQIDADNREHLLGRRNWSATPCPWCHRRGEHTPACLWMRDEWKMRFEFGKHKGRAIVDVERSYLRWVLRNCDWLTSEVRTEIERVLDVISVMTMFK